MIGTIVFVWIITIFLLWSEGASDQAMTLGAIGFIVGVLWYITRETWCSVVTPTVIRLRKWWKSTDPDLNK